MPQQSEQLAPRGSLELSDKRIPETFLLLRVKDYSFKNMTSAFTTTDWNDSSFAGFVVCQGTKRCSGSRARSPRRSSR